MGEPARPFRENPRLLLGPGTAVSYFPLECSSFREEAADGEGGQGGRGFPASRVSRGVEAPGPACLSGGCRQKWAEL